MKRRFAYIETISLSIVATLVSVLAVQQLLAGHASSPDLSGAFATRRTVISLVALVYGGVLAVLAVSSLLLIRSRSTTLFRQCLHGGRAVVREAYAAWRWSCETTGLRYSTSWLALMIAIGAGLRGYFMAQPIRYDEAFTFLSFVKPGALYLFYYPVPNNHVLHTLLVRLSVDCFGSHPIVIRLPAFIAGLCVIPATYCLSRLITRNNNSGFLATALIAVYPYVVLYDTMARGYSITVLLSICLAILGYRLAEYPSIRLCALMSLVTALGLFAMPSFLFPAVGILPWSFALLAQRTQQAPRFIIKRFVMPFALMTATLTGVFYTPCIVATNGIQPIISNDYVRSLPWPEFLQALPGHCGRTLQEFARSVPVMALSVGLLLLTVGCYTLVRHRQWSAITLFAVLVAGGALVLFLKHAIPFGRTWIYLLPFAFVVVDAGFATIVKSIGVYGGRGIALLVAIVTAVLLMSHDTVSYFEDTGTFREAPLVVNVLAREMQPGDELVVGIPGDLPIAYYMWRQQVPRARSAANGAASPKKFVIVQNNPYASTQPTTLGLRKLMEIGEAELYVSDLSEHQAEADRLD